MSAGMRAAALAVALMACSPCTGGAGPRWMHAGSIWRGQCWHVGIRPAAATDGAGVTLQVSR